LNIGLKCNIKCKFCYYLDRLNDPFEDFDKLVERLVNFRKADIDKLHITGGEPTIYKGLFDLVRKARELGFVDIGVITNGIMLRNKEYAEQCKEAGIDNFIISLHGHTAELHDELTQSKNSYDSILRAIKNLNEIGMPFQINHVVTKNNYRFLMDFSKLMIEMKPEIVTLLYFNPMNFSSALMGMSAKYSETISYLHEAIDILEKNNVDVCFKFLPLCALKNQHEKYLMNLSQAYYEDWEWNYEKRLLLDAGKKEYKRRQLCFFRNFSKQQINHLPMDILMYLNSLLSCQYDFYTKLDVCKSCRYDLICHGVDKYYIGQFGDGEFKPIPGEKIINPTAPIYDDEPDAYKISFYQKIINYLTFYYSRYFTKKIN